MSHFRFTRVDRENYSRVLLEDYQGEVAQIWPELRTRPALHTWLRVVKHATTACEGVRRGDWRLVLEEIAKVVVWWLAFIEKLNVLARQASAADEDIVFAVPLTASEIVWNKYPGVCPVEFGVRSKRKEPPDWHARPAKRCMCLARKWQVESRPPEEKERTKELVRTFAQRHKGRRPRSISELEGMLRGVFAGQIAVLNVEEISFHFLEEVGEVSEALANATTSEAAARESVSEEDFTAERRRKALAIAEELADVFSWAVTFVAKVQAELSSFDQYLEERAEPKELRGIRRLLGGARRLNLAEIVWQKYGLEFGELRCADCRNRSCSCAAEKERPLQGETLGALRAKVVQTLLRLAQDDG